MSLIKRFAGTLRFPDSKQAWRRPANRRRSGRENQIITGILSVPLLLVFGTATVAATGNEPGVIRLATTTSTENSGLLKYLLPAFEKGTGYQIHVIAVGTGKALRLVREGDVDVVLVHARKAEDQLVADGFGVNRRDVMYNDFVIVGPLEDPAGIRGSHDATAALARIAATGSLFVSRGDDSGTHKKEHQLWQDAGIRPVDPWYREAGQGMGKVLQMAGEMQAYTLTDRGTWLAYQDKIPLQIVTEQDPRLFNPYGIIAVNYEKYPDANFSGALKLIEWITAAPAQEMIGNFTIDGQRLFTPSSGSTRAAPAQ
jgi:tungstate transport system substrate-binding protein